MRVLLISILLVGCVATESEEPSELMDHTDDGQHHCPTAQNGSGAGDPGPKPDRKSCEDQGAFPSIDGCKDCCWYNYNHVDGWDCRREKNDKKRRLCWERATQDMASCNAQCEWDRGGITTLAP